MGISFSMNDFSFNAADLSESCRQILSLSRMNDVAFIIFITIVGFIIANLILKKKRVTIFGGFSVTIVLLIFKWVITSIYDGISQDLNTVCDGNSISAWVNLYPNNKFLVILTFVYYYLKTYALVICKSLFVFLIVYIVFTSIKCLVFNEREIPPFCGFIEEMQGGWKKYMFYAILGVISAFLYFLVYLYTNYEAKLFFIQTSVNDYDIKQSQLTFTTLILVSILILFPWNIISYYVTRLFGIVCRHLNVHDALSHTKMFALIKNSLSIHLTIFIQGLIMCIVYAAVMIPTVDLNGYCANNAASDSDKCACTGANVQLQEDFQLFGNRLIVGYYIIMILLVISYARHALSGIHLRE